jgi:uncharacterized protein with von Willebrand factor type A (vWA) domain
MRAGAAQRGEGAAVPRRRRLDGPARQGLRGAVLGGAAEFKHLEYFYFHNCLYERRVEGQPPPRTRATPTWDVLHTYPHDYKVIFVGDASMSPYEIVTPGGSVEHWNEEAGMVWLQRVLDGLPEGRVAQP